MRAISRSAGPEHTTLDSAMAASLLPSSTVMVGMSAIFTTATGSPLTTPAGSAVLIRSTFGGMTLAPLFDTFSIVSPPASQTVTAGELATFAIGVGEFSPVVYQWAFNGANILGATESTYTISNVQYADAGTYAVSVTNSYGSTNAQAVLQVVPPGGPSIRINGQLAVGTVACNCLCTTDYRRRLPNGFIFYTLDGSVPTTSSALYSGPITLTNSVTIHAMSLSADFSRVLCLPRSRCRSFQFTACRLRGGQRHHQRQPEPTARIRKQ